MKAFSKTILIIFVATSLFACYEVRKSVTAWYEGGATDEVVGKRHFLEDNGIKLLLPSEFEKYSISAYQKMLDSLLTPEQFKAEVNRVEQLQKMEGTLYLFVDKIYGITLTASTIPYMPFKKQDAQQLLNLTAQSHKQEARKYGFEVEKLEAKYNGNTNVQLFKSKYRFKVKNKELEWFTSNYIITSNGKSLFLQLTSPFTVEFDPFVKKTIF